MRNFFIIFALISFSVSTFSQKEKTIESKKWDVNNPHKDWNYKTFNLSTDEGTWMNLDVSPDGKSNAGKGGLDLGLLGGSGT